MERKTLNRCVLFLVLANLIASAQTQSPLNSFSAFGDTEQDRPIAPGDVASLIANLAGDMPETLQTRVFSSGQQLENYPETATVVDRSDASFSPQTQSLIATGTLNGTPVIEDFRFMSFEGTFYVFRDIYLNGTFADVAGGRTTPGTLPTDREEGQTGAGNVHRAGLTSALAVQSPPSLTISAIHGYSNDSDGISDGVVSMSCGRTFNGYRAINNSQATFTWDVYGTNFGASKGTIQLAGMTVPASAISLWSTNRVTFTPSVPYYFAAGPTVLSISSATGGNVKNYLNFAPGIQTRLYGQCTWLVALMRLNAGKQPSGSAYPPGTGWNQLTPSYIPQVWDQLVFEWGQNKHTAIITNVSAPSKNGTTTTWTVTITEANAACNNQITSLQSSFQVQNGKITKSIQTRATSSAPGWWYR